MSGDAESFEKPSNATKQHSIVESAVSSKIKIDTDTSIDGPSKSQNDTIIQNRSSTVTHLKIPSMGENRHTFQTNSPRGDNEPVDQLPEVEDIQEAEENTMIANKIRISNIKGSSHAHILSPPKKPNYSN